MEFSKELNGIRNLAKKRRESNKASNRNQNVIKKEMEFSKEFNGIRNLAKKRRD
jgi:hypothetical protein